MDTTNTQIIDRLPLDGLSRWSQFKKFSPVCRETFRQMTISGRAPKPIKLGRKVVCYSNQELHKFLQNPLSYKAE
jgi:predicted DNA-binding transcriptional regulator AlpA